jgi:peptidoglycan L-alanyl-D-glutamate endopeptidase CwlK
MASRKIEDLHPTLQPIAREFLRRCEAAGLQVFMVCTYRSGAEQDALFAQGRTTKGRIVTNARAGQSSHNFTLPNGVPAAKAFDIGVLLNGKYDGAGKSPDWKKAGAIGMELGLNWYGAPKAKFREMPHFELKA